MPTLTEITKFTVLDCAECHVKFAVTDALVRARHQDHRNFYCPNGHTNYYPQETEEERLRRELAKAEGIAAESRSAAKRAELQLEGERRSHAATKGHLTKSRKRVANGVCPCCNRSFVQLGRHMATKHPEMQLEAAGK